MHPSKAHRIRRIAAGCCAAVAVLALPAVAAAGPAPTVKVHGGAVRGATAPGGLVYRGVPYAAAPTGARRWRAPQAPAAWRGVRDATAFAPICPQPETPFTAGKVSEDCLYLNVSTPSVRPQDGQRRPVLVWFHGGGYVLGAGSDYDPARLAAAGTVVVTVNYRLGALGFLAHPALADHPGGPAGNYGLMDQQAALRWVRDNIARFGGDPRKVTIAGQSAGGLAVLEHLIAPGSRGLFSRAIVESGAVALTQQPLAAAERDGEALAAKAGCPDQSAACLRGLPASALVAATPANLIPGVVDGAVVRESLGTALAAGRFAHVPLLDGTNHDEERLFLAIGSTVTGGRGVPLPEPVTADSYERVIASSFGVSAARAAAIAARYPLGSYGSAAVAFSQLQTDANFTCPALQVDRWTAARGVPTYAYELNEDRAPERFIPQIATPTEATHQTELQFLFGLPNAPLPGPLTAAQAQLGGSIRAAWSAFAADGNPAAGRGTVAWPAFGRRAGNVLSLVAPAPRVATDTAARHQCGFWDQAAG
jgi:para-nitrobenzyl esterase